MPANLENSAVATGLEKGSFHFNPKERQCQRMLKLLHNCTHLTHSEKAMATHSSTLAWQIPWTEEPGRLQSKGSLGVRHDWVTSLSLFTFMHWRRKWQPTPVFLPGESQGWRSLGWLKSMVSHRDGHDWSDLAALAAHASKVMLKILQARLQQYMNRELPDVQAGFRKGRGIRDQIANIHWIKKKGREFQKKHLFLLYWLCQSLWLWGSQ